jgi:hypothetical protein
MLRLDPAHPPLWRSPTCLQFGLSGSARLEEPHPWEERLIAALARGMTDEALAERLRAERIDAEEADALLAELQPVLRRVGEAPRIVLEVADDLPASLAETVEGAMSRAGAVVRTVPHAGWGAGPVGRDETVVLLAAHLVDPRRAAALVSSDVRHLPLVLDGAGAEIGPLVVPGRTACLACGAAHATDADAAWPALAAQLLRRAFAADLDVAREASRVAVQLIAAPGEPTARSVRLRADAPNRVWQAHPPHEECRCRSLEGSGTAPVRLAPVREPSSRPAFARPA